MQKLINKQIGQRTHSRFRVECVACVKLSNSMVGIMTEISKKGLVFRYIHEDSEDKINANELLTVSIYKNGFSLHNVPCRVIKDNDILPEYYLSSAKMQKCHIQFGELTRDQKSQLDYFISHYTKINGQT
jgi:hypothetical protein